MFTEMVSKQRIKNTNFEDTNSKLKMAGNFMALPQIDRVSQMNEYFRPDNLYKLHGRESFNSRYFESFHALFLQYISFASRPTFILG